MRAEGVAGSRRELPGQVDRRPHAQSGAQPDEKRRVVVTRKILEIRVVHPDRLNVDSAVVAKLARDRQAERGGVVVAEVVGAVHTCQHAEAERGTAALVEHVVLAEERDRPVARPQDAGLQPARQAEAVLEADDGAIVEAEKVFRERPEVVLAERPQEPVRDAESAFHPRQPDRGWQIDKHEVRLRRVGVEIDVVCCCCWSWILGIGRGAHRNGEHENDNARRAHRSAPWMPRTISIPVMSLWPLPQYSEQRIGKFPSVVAVKSIVTASPPRGTSFLIFSFLISTDRTSTRLNSS